MTAGGSHPDQEIALLQSRLAVAEETLRALRAGEVDAIVMDTGQGEQQIYTLETADRPYRHLVERMSEGAALADADGLIVYANRRLATLLGVPLERHTEQSGETSVGVHDQAIGIGQGGTLGHPLHQMPVGAVRGLQRVDLLL